MALLKRVLTICLALAFLVSMTGQLLPASMAGPEATASAGMAGGCDGPQQPCSGHLPYCLNHGGCIMVSVLPASPTSMAIPVDWASVDYDLAPQALGGIFVKPELSPPILAA